MKAEEGAAEVPSPFRWVAQLMVTHAYRAQCAEGCPQKHLKTTRKTQQSICDKTVWVWHPVLPRRPEGQPKFELR